MVLSSEVTGLGNGADLTEVQLLSATTVNAGFGAVEWYVCHTSLNELTTTYAANYDGNTPQKVYTNSALTINAVNGQWFGFTFTPAFKYDGKRNLIFELRYGSNSGSSINAQGASKPKRVVEAENANASAGSYGPFDWMPSLRIYYGGTGAITINDTKNQSGLFSIAKNYDNTFLINYSIAEPSDTRITLYDIAGRLVKMLENRKQDAGSHSLCINPVTVTSGIYIVQVETNENTQQKKLMLGK